MGIAAKIKRLFNKDHPAETRIEMITQRGNGYYSFSGNLYHSDMVRAAIRPYAKAVGKLIGKHIRKCGSETKVNPEPYIRFLLEEPNPFMSGQVMQEKIATQLALNNNAFILKTYDELGKVAELYPIPASSATAVYDNIGTLYLKFVFLNGKQKTFKYSDIIHLRNDYNQNDIFGESPADALTQLMEVATIADQSLIKAIKNSGIIRWILKYANKMRPDDLEDNVKDFTKTYLSVESETFGAAGVSGDCDVQRVEPKDYVPNAAHTQNVLKRVYAFFNTNEKIVHSTYTEAEWNSYFESVIEPTALQMSNEYTRKLFSRRERGSGNSIYFEASNLQCATLQTKLALVAMVDRGALTPNEWRDTFNLAPVEGGDTPIRRLDTAPTTAEGGE